MPDEPLAEDDLRLIAEARRTRAVRSGGYRAQALRLFPPICAKCAREFTGKRIRELTVHHRDHNHDNNPPDGSNWELLCLYCHEQEHSRRDIARAATQSQPEERPSNATNQPFADLDRLLKKTHGEEG